MTSSSSRRPALFVTVVLASASIGAAEQPGDQWQVTSKMSMTGMPGDMPAQSTKVCTARNSQEPPGAANDERGCKNTDMKKTGNKVTFTSTCAGPPPMKGKGEITYEGTDAYTGSIEYVTDHGPMTIKLSGKKLGACDKPT